MVTSYSRGFARTKPRFASLEDYVRARKIYMQMRSRLKERLARHYKDMGQLNNDPGERLRSSRNREINRTPEPH